MEDTLDRWRSQKTAAYLSSAVAAAERDTDKAAHAPPCALSGEEAEQRAGLRMLAIGAAAAAATYGIGSLFNVATS
jgi:hypothetical protein